MNVSEEFIISLLDKKDRLKWNKMLKGHEKLMDYLKNDYHSCVESLGVSNGAKLNEEERQVFLTECLIKYGMERRGK